MPPAYRIPVYVVETGRRFHSRSRYGASFKPAYRPAVKGGRWQVRKLISKGRWRVWTSGVGREYNITLTRWDHAIEYAQLMAKVFNDPQYALYRHEVLKSIRKAYRDLDKAARAR